MVDVSFQVLLQTFVNALLLSMIYMLVAIGLTLILSIMNLINFAHSELYMLGGFSVYFVCERLAYNYWLGILLGIVIAVLIGVVLERFIFRPLRNELLPASFVALGIGLIMQTLVLMLFGAMEKDVGTVFPGVLHFFGIFIPMEKVVIFLAGLGVAGAIIIFVKYFRAGQALQAVAQDPEAALLMGININHINAMGFGIGCGLAAAAGGFIAPLYFISPYMGMNPLFKAFTVIIIGGLGSIPGAVIASFILGFIEQFSLTFLGYVGNISGFILIMLILLFRPRGLMGRELRTH